VFGMVFTKFMVYFGEDLVAFGSVMGDFATEIILGIL